MIPEQEIERKLFISSSSPGIRQKKKLFTTRSLLSSGLASLIYLAVSYFLVGFRSDQLVLVGIFNLCYFASHTTRRFILGFSIFIVYWIIFDYMKAFPNYRFNEVNIASLYHAEKELFGIHFNGSILTPNEYLALHTTTFLDVITGIFYLCWVPVPLAFASFLFFRNKKAFFQFSLTFFLVNCIGFIGYYTYPAAPPWYVLQHGFDFNPNTPGNTAGFSRFDSYFNVSVFKGMYAKSSNVFAAMPSMHAAFMMIVLFFGLKLRMGAWNILFATIMTGIWFGAVYSFHHYVLDVIAGIFCAIMAIMSLQLWFRTRAGKKAINALIKVTSK
jgi:hypothetical protein